MTDLLLWYALGLSGLALGGAVACLLLIKQQAQTLITASQTAGSMLEIIKGQDGRILRLQTEVQMLRLVAHQHSPRGDVLDAPPSPQVH